MPHDVGDIITDNKRNPVGFLFMMFSDAAEMIEKAMKAGKHVICEKALSGYLGKEGDKQLIGQNMPKSYMYEQLLNSLDRLKR